MILQMKPTYFLPENYHISLQMSMNKYQSIRFYGLFNVVVDEKDLSLHPLLEEISRWRKLLMPEYQKHKLTR